jgi:type VI secretion system protein VasD
MNLTLAAAERLNQDDKGQALATVVRIYQLKSATRLEHAEFEDMWLRANDVLAGDLVKVDEFTLFPNDKLDKPLVLEKDTAFVAAVALVRKPGGVSWRSIYALPSTRCDWRGHKPRLARRFVLEDYSVASVAP